jgi:predicted MPP superfamily phosphohydrolase
LSFLSRRKFLKTSAALVATGALVVSADATLWEPNHPYFTQLEVPIPRLPTAWDGVRIVQLSDFHYDEYFSAVPIRKAAAMVNALQPDLVVLTGDFITSPMREDPAHKAKENMEPCAVLLGEIRARLGSFAVLGNHDLDVDAYHVIECLEARGIRVLRNSAFPLEKDGARLWLSGVDDVLFGAPDLDATLRSVPASEPVVLLCHEPDYARHAARHAVDLQLSGHSHGGQIRFPLVGPLYLPDLGKEFPWGSYQVGKLRLYTNAGIGTIRLPIRWNCPPEITVLTLRSGAV